MFYRQIWFGDWKSISSPNRIPDWHACMETLPCDSFAMNIDFTRMTKCILMEKQQLFQPPTFPDSDLVGGNHQGWLLSFRLSLLLLQARWHQNPPSNSIHPSSEGDFTRGACCCVRDDCCRCQPWPPDQHHDQAPPKQGFVVTMIIAMTSASHEISRSCTISRNKINFLFVRLSFTFQTWASATLGQLFSSKSFSGATENFLHGANRSLEWTFFRHCPKSRSSVCPDYLNRLHDFLGVDPSNLRMAGVRKLHFMIISIYRWSAFSTSTQWSWIPILWQWSYTCPGEIKIPQLLVA